jgi:hypothetical protein
MYRTTLTGHELVGYKDTNQTLHAKVKAGDVEYRAMLISAAEQQKCALATKANELKRVSRDLREARSKVLTKKIDGQLQLKLQQAAQEKYRLALEKEKLGLQR